MEPILTTILAALVAGAAAGSKDVAGKVVKDAYAGLKGLILRRFRGKSEVEDALEKVEKDAESEARRAFLKEELEKAGVEKDEEVLQRANALTDLLKEHGLFGPSYQAMLKGDGAIAQGPGAVAAGKGGVLVRGNMKGNIMTGSGNIIGGSGKDQPDREA